MIFPRPLYFCSAKISLISLRHTTSVIRLFTSIFPWERSATALPCVYGLMKDALIETSFFKQLKRQDIHARIRTCQPKEHRRSAPARMFDCIFHRNDAADALDGGIDTRNAMRRKYLVDLLRQRIKRDIRAQLQRHLALRQKSVRRQSSPQRHSVLQAAS